MTQNQPKQARIGRREMLAGASGGLASIALASLLAGRRQRGRCGKARY